MQLTKEEALNKLQKTQNQLEELKSYIDNLPKQYTIEDITSLDIAEEILKGCKEHTKCTEIEFPLEKYWKQYQLETIQNAINYIDNGNQWWTPNWKDQNEYKYYPYFLLTDSGWCFGGVFGLPGGCGGSGSFALKTNKGARHLSKTFIRLFF